MSQRLRNDVHRLLSIIVIIAMLLPSVAATMPIGEVEAAALPAPDAAPVRQQGGGTQAYVLYLPVIFKGASSTVTEITLNVGRVENCRQKMGEFGWFSTRRPLPRP